MTDEVKVVWCATSLMVHCRKFSKICVVSLPSTMVFSLSQVWICSIVAADPLLSPLLYASLISQPLITLVALILFDVLF